MNQNPFGPPPGAPPAPGYPAPGFPAQQPPQQTAPFQGYAPQGAQGYASAAPGPYQAPPGPYMNPPPAAQAPVFDFGKMGQVDPSTSSPRFALGQHVALFEKCEPFRGSSGSYVFFHFRIEQSNSMPPGMTCAHGQNLAPACHGSDEVAARGLLQWMLPICRVPEEQSRAVDWRAAMQEVMTSGTFQGRTVVGNRVSVTVAPGDPKKAKPGKEPFPRISVSAL